MTSETTADTTTGPADEAVSASEERPADDASPGPAGASSGRSRLARLEQEGDIAADYLEGLLDIADLDGDIDLDVEGDRASVAIVGDDLDELVGSGGKVLEALQELTRLAVQAKTGERSRLMLDIGGYRAGRRTELLEVGRDAARRARETGERVVLPAMPAFERKVVHDAVAAEGLRSESEGVEPARKVVVLPR